MANKPGYFKKYYEEKKDDILGARKQRYQTDPDYKDKVLKSSRDYRQKQRREPRVKMPRYQKPLVGVSKTGVEVSLFSVGALAVFLSRSVQAINHWEARGLIPSTPYKDGRGFRYYTQPMMAAIKIEVGTKRRLFPVDPLMSARIAEKWAAQGVPLSYTGDDPYEAIALTRGSSGVSAAASK